MSQACSQSMKRAGLALLGIPLMVIGLIGWVMPIIPGAPLFFFGLALTISWHALQLGAEITDFLESHPDEVEYRMKSPFHRHRGVIGSAGLVALRKAIETVCRARQ